MMLREIKLGSSIMETCGTTQVAHLWSQPCFFLFLIRARLFPTPAGLSAFFGILSTWKACLMAKVSTKCFFRRAFLYNSCLQKLLLSSCSEYYFAFSNTLLSSCLAYLLIELFMVLLSPGMHTPQQKWFYLVHFPCSCGSSDSTWHIVGVPSNKFLMEYLLHKIYLP